MWIVKLTKPPAVNDFRAGFFPRRYRMLVDARKLQDEVRSKGGDATIEEEGKA